MSFLVQGTCCKSLFQLFLKSQVKNQDRDNTDYGSSHLLAVIAGHTTACKGKDTHGKTADCLAGCKGKHENQFIPVAQETDNNHGRSHRYGHGDYNVVENPQVAAAVDKGCFNHGIRDAFDKGGGQVDVKR